MKRIGLGLKIMLFTTILIVVTAGFLIYSSYILDMDSDMETSQEKLAEKTRRLVIISAVILAIAILSSFILSRRLVMKLRYLTDITKKISMGQMEREIKVKSRDEVGELAESLERMRVSLKMAMDMIDEKEKDH